MCIFMYTYIYMYIYTYTCVYASVIICISVQDTTNLSIPTIPNLIGFSEFWIQISHLPPRPDWPLLWLVRGVNCNSYVRSMLNPKPSTSIIVQLMHSLKIRDVFKHESKTTSHVLPIKFSGSNCVKIGCNRYFEPRRAKVRPGRHVIKEPQSYQFHATCVDVLQGEGVKARHDERVMVIVIVMMMMMMMTTMVIMVLVVKIEVVSVLDVRISGPSEVSYSFFVLKAASNLERFVTILEMWNQSKSQPFTCQEFVPTQHKLKISSGFCGPDGSPFDTVHSPVLSLHLFCFSPTLHIQLCDVCRSENGMTTTVSNSNFRGIPPIFRQIQPYCWFFPVNMRMNIHQIPIACG